jgi:spore coat polysaccharide biosynthesis protein SpsF
MSDVLVVVQARMGSTRLPGKVALPLAGAPLLVRMLERVRAAATPFDLCVATSTAPEDDEVVEMARAAGVGVFRGDPLDCLARHLGAARAAGAKHVVKIPSDCPLVDPAAIDLVLGEYLRDPPAYDYVSNLHPPSWPDGNDVEVFSIEALEIAAREATLALEREHTTPFFWERPDRFRIKNVLLPSGGDHSQTHRFTIDYPEDYEVICAVYEALYRAGQPPAGVDEILAWVDARPDVLAKNARYARVNWYRHHLGELRTITADMTRTDVP